MKIKFLIATLLVAQFGFAQKSVMLDDVWRNYKFYATGISGLRSTIDGAHYTTFAKGILLKNSYTDANQIDTLLKTATLSFNGVALEVDDYAFSANEKQLLLSTQTESIYRYSTKSVAFVYDLGAKKLTQIAPEKVRFSTFSPDGTKVAYVSNNDLYYYDLASGNTQRITTDGEKNKIINGATDWVYEEEFAFDRAFFWSADGQNLVYYRFDETAVPEFSMDIYGTELYPTQDRFKYPKAGEPNAKVTIHIYNLQSNNKKQVLQNAAYEYIPRVKFTQDANMFVVYTLNRHQNHLQLHAVNATTGASSLLYEEKDAAYIEISDDVAFLKDGSFVWSSDRDGYQHLYLISKGKIAKQLTTGKYDVEKLYGVDEDTKTVFYQSNEAHVSEKNVYSIGLNGKAKKNLTPKKGSNNADFSSNFKYFVNTYSSVTSPPLVNVQDAAGKEVRVLKDNAGIVKRLEEYKMSPKEFTTITTASGVNLSSWIIKPLNFDETKKYPLLMFVYGGPGNQQVLNNYDAFNGMWYQALAAKGYMIVCVDNRGTGGKGREFEKCTYQQLGKLEAQDQIESAQYFGSLPYVDASRIGIWGWSYGGFMSSNCLFQGPDVFKAAIAVAPVTNWRFYDNIYTERYMRTPQENAEGYDNNSPINHVKGLKGNYLLIHGTADDNVHVQNTMRMVEELVQANKQFDLFIYPDKNHSIFGGNTRYHLYKMMTDFLDENLAK